MTFWKSLWNSSHWLPAYLWERLQRRPSPAGPVHLIIGLADHFEPGIVPGHGEARAPRSEQERRLERWCAVYPGLVDPWRDSDGYPFRHTYFYPAEQYDKDLIDRLAEHCHMGWGEIEIHLHHGIEAPDTAERTRRVLVDFRNELVRRGCLSRMHDSELPRYAFVHGNFTLANSGGGACCGVDEEMQVLAETGCYADLTLPSAPNPSQVGKINVLYECRLPLNSRSPHRWGQDLECGRAPKVFPLIIQGPLIVDFAKRRRGLPIPGIENSALTTLRPPTLARLRLWRQAAITVRGRPNWVFIKLHCHGMDPRDDEAMLGSLMREFLRALTKESQGGRAYSVHFVTAREMVNIALAACDGCDGNPGEYRNYRLTLYRAQARAQLHVGARPEYEEVRREN